MKLKSINDSARPLPAIEEIERMREGTPLQFLPFESPSDQAKQKRMTDATTKHASERGWRELNPSFLLERRKWSLKAQVWFLPIFSVHGEGAEPADRIHTNNSTHSLVMNKETWAGPEGLRSVVNYDGQMKNADSRRCAIGIGLFMAAGIIGVSGLIAPLMEPAMFGVCLLFSALSVLVSFCLHRVGFGWSCKIWSPMNGGMLPNDVKSDYNDILKMDGYSPLVIREAENWEISSSPRPVAPDPLLCAVHRRSGRLFLVRHFDLTPVETQAMLKSIV